MRVDFILPVLLAFVLLLMVVYASTARGKDQAIRTAPVVCENGAVVASLRDIPEASGLAASVREQQLFWAHNDSAEPYVYGVGPDGSTRARVRVAGASVKDWEAVTVGACDSAACLFIGDIGDNDRSRSSVVVYRTVEPNAQDDATADVTAMEAVYPDGPQDAEALFVADGRVHIVTKGEGGPVRLYRFPSLQGGRQTLELVATLIPNPSDKTFRVTDGAISPDERWIALRTNDLLLFYERASLLAGTPGTPLAYDLRALKEPQGEGVAWADARTLVLAGEGKGAGTFARISCNLPS